MRERAQERGERLLGVERDAGAARLERERAVHGAGVDEDVAEAGGERAPGGGLAGPRRPVDRDHETAGSHAPLLLAGGVQRLEKPSFSSAVPTETRSQLAIP